MRLTDEEFRDVLRRAEELDAGASSPARRSEFDAVVQAAEEVGISRPAVEQALRERFGTTVTPPAPGDHVFARSADGKFYVAEVLTATDSSVGVRFLRGGQHIVGFDQVRPCTFLPGERIVVPWPWWGPWTCAVVRYHAEYQQVTVSDGWSEMTFPLKDVWVDPPRPARWSRVRLYAALVGAGIVVGALATAIFLR